MSKMELLAPAGNFECMVAAVQSGADAVYLSGKSFGARSFADNFDHDSLEKAVDYCHLRGVKVYVTVNTLAKDDEIEELEQYLRFVNNIGTDAIIVQDMGILKIAAETAPLLPVHASTQMTVQNSEGVKALEALGVKRVVLSREVSLENIKKISQETDAELEVFGHGALCMCYSGQCLMSSVIGSRSGNRGKCAQPCRLPYSVNGKSSQRFYLSLKDLSSLGLLDEMEAAGVSSLKIEGRMKGPAYVAAVVGIYRKYIDCPGNVKKEDLTLLDTIFNRGGLTDGYLTNMHGKNMFAFDKPDNPYRKSCDKLANELLNSLKGENKKLRLKARLCIRVGALPQITIEHKDFKIEYTGEDAAEKAANTPLIAKGVITQLQKTGGTPFEFDEISVDLENDSFLAAGAINKLRRNALELFEKKYLQTFKRQSPSPTDLELSDILPRKRQFTCEVTNMKQFYIANKYDFSRIFVPLHIIKSNKEELYQFRDKIVIVPPAIVHENELNQLISTSNALLDEGYFGIMATNIALIKPFSGHRVFGGFRLNIFNSYSLDFFKSQGVVSAELSPELSVKQLKAMKKSIPTQVMVYGRLPLMVSENCVVKNGDLCPCGNENYITDRLGMRFPVIKDGNSCRNIILNCKKTFLGFDMDKLYSAGVEVFRIYFTDENPDECKKICDSFFFGTGYRPDDFTKGHFVKGVL